MNDLDRDMIQNLFRGLRGFTSLLTILISRISCIRYRIYDIGVIMNNNDQNKERQHHRPWRNPGFRHIQHIDRFQFGQRGFLRPQIIQIIEKQPVNGVDIMSKLQEMSHGWYRPSPGSIYPLLEQLEKEGVIVKNKDGKFELSTTYAEQIGVGKDVGSAISAIESNVSYLEDLQKTDVKRLTRCRDRVEKLTRRLVALDDALQSRSGP